MKCNGYKFICNSAVFVAYSKTLLTSVLCSIDNASKMTLKQKIKLRFIASHDFCNTMQISEDRSADIPSSGASIFRFKYVYKLSHF